MATWHPSRGFLTALALFALLGGAVVLFSAGYGYGVSRSDTSYIYDNAYIGSDGSGALTIGADAGTASSILQDIGTANYASLTRYARGIDSSTIGFGYGEWGGVSGSDFIQNLGYYDTGGATWTPTLYQYLTGSNVGEWWLAPGYGLNYDAQTYMKISSSAKQLTPASGVVTWAPGFYITIEPEGGGGAPDCVETISGAAGALMLIFRGASSAITITDDGAGTCDGGSPNIKLNQADPGLDGSGNCVLDSADDNILLWGYDGTTIRQIGPCNSGM